MGWSGFLTAQRVCSGGGRGRFVVSDIANRCSFSLSFLLPRPPSWITLGKPKSEQERGCDVCVVPASPLLYFPELLLVFGGEKVQICLIVPLLPAGLAGSPPPSHLLKTTQTPTSVVSFLHFCFSPFW